MSILFKCAQCHKSYQISESLAGRRGRCKACGHEFRVPDLAAAARPAADPYALEEDPDEARLPPRAGFGPVPSKSARSSRGGGSNEGLAAWGYRFLAFGAGIFLLPLIGLQFKGIHFLSAATQMTIGMISLGMGVVCLFVAHASTVLSLAGLGALVLSVIAFLTYRGGLPANLPGPPPVVGGGQPPAAQPVDLAGGIQAPPGPAAEFAPGPPPAAPTPAPAPAQSQAPASDQVKVVLSNARVTREGLMIMQDLHFQVDYRVEGPGLRPGEHYLWIIEAPGFRASRRLFVLGGQGTLSGAVHERPGSGGGTTTTFQTYLVVESVFRGRQERKVSDVVSAQWVSNPQPNPSPAMPRPWPHRPPGFPPFPRPMRPPNAGPASPPF